MTSKINLNKHQTHQIPRSLAPALCHQPFEGSLEHPKLKCSAIARFFDSKKWQSCSYRPGHSGRSIITRKKYDTNNSKFAELQSFDTEICQFAALDVSFINTQQLQAMNKVHPARMKTSDFQNLQFSCHQYLPGLASRMLSS